MDRFLFFIVLISFYCVYARITIVELVVPQSIEYTLDNVSHVVLDCVYDAEEEEDLEVKWYHNGINHPIYQWIPSSNRRGEALGVFKHHIDVRYSVVDDNQQYLYRALKLTNLTRDLTGNYTCQISSNFNEVRETKPLVFYSPPKSGIELSLADEEPRQVVCAAEGVYPRPEMDISITRENGENVDLEVDVEENTYTEVDEDDFGFYSINTTIFLDNLTSIEGMGNLNFVCNLSIPGTNYSDTEYVEYDSDMMQLVEKLVEEGLHNISVIDYDGNSTEDNTTEGKSSAVIYYPTLCLSTLLLVLLLVTSK